MTAATVTTADPTPLLARKLRHARGRLLAQRLVDLLCAALLVAGAGLLAGGAVSFLRGGETFSARWTGIVLGAALAGALGGAFGGWISLGLVAKYLDARAGTQDRFHTALAFSQRQPRSPFEELTLAECTRFIDHFPVHRWTPILLPRAARFLAVPVIALALLSWHASLRIGQPPADPVLDAALAQRAAALQTLAGKLNRPATPTQAPDLARLAAEMKRSAARLRAAAATPAATDKLKGALGELSSLEAMLAAVQQAASEPSASPAELAALSAALAASPQTQDAAKALQDGKLAEAATKLEQLLEQLKKNGNAAQALQQLAQSWQDQAAKLSAAQKSEVARQMQQAAQAAQSGQTQLSEQALQRLADLLRKLGRGGAGQAGRSASGSTGAGAGLTPSQLQNLLNALENMKAGLPGQGGSPGSPSDSQAGEPSLAVMESFAPKPGDSGVGNQPSGLPGSEHDTGTSDKLFADRPLADPKGARATRLEGLLGDGQSLQQLVGAASDHAKANRPYRELYNAMAPAAQDAVEQEDIPLGSRFFIERYFNNIRP